MANPDLVLFDPKVQTKAFSVGATRIRIVQGPAQLLVQNLGPDPVYLGGEDVTPASGFPVPTGSGDPLRLALAPGAWLYAVSSGSSDLRVMLLG